MLTIAPLQPHDRAAWEELARGYKAFYETPTSDAAYDVAWHRLLAADDVFGLGAYDDGRLVGIAHFLFHPTTWGSRSCYLQDLFTSPAERGKGVARALIEAVAMRAREAGADRYYWNTQEHNAVARGLYDKVAKYRGFIRYEFPLQP